MPEPCQRAPEHVRAFGDRMLTRRGFLALTTSALLGSILAACSNDDGDETPEAADTASPTLVSSTPAAGSTPGGESSATSTVAAAASPEGSPAGDRSVAMFLTLSSALTGFEDLEDVELAQTYLTNLGPEGQSLIDLYAAVGLESPDVALSLEQIEDAGVYDDESLAALADKITTCWYSGKYQQAAGDPAVATFINALGWQATGYRLTGPSTCSGQTGVWATPPA